jgi:hypothetical protein
MAAAPPGLVDDGIVVTDALYTSRWRDKFFGSRTLTPKGAHRHAAIAMGAFASATREATERVGKCGVKRNGPDRRHLAERHAFK